MSATFKMMAVAMMMTVKIVDLAQALPMDSVAR